ncbi:MAG: phosphatase PAP2 family protein [Acidimicrobiia bacterium]|nr:phosphatase PAP2 family protein [Acidimicrobiia bacterium]MDH5616517.1 phosphatase PAP2 family protein [Acidimicrobiia bacterium]
MSSDETVFRWLNDLAGQSNVFDGFIRLVISDYLIPFIATLAVAWLWFAGRREEETGRFQHAALHGLVALGLSQLAVALINIAVGRPRPFEQLPDVTVLFYEPINSSFPAHPIATIVALGVVVWMVHRWLGTLVLALGLLLGIGRIVAGLWFPTDVLGGIAIGALSAWLGGLVLGRLAGAEAFIRRKTASLGLE